MKKDDFELLSQSLQDAIAHAQGGQNTCRTVHVNQVPDVRLIRQRLNMTQQAFCRTFGFSTETLRNWEQGKRKPAGAARILLHVIAQEPQAVLRAVAQYGDG